MLSSSFSESSQAVPGKRKEFTIICEEADFETMYWLLKWVYANWLLFKEHDDPRAAVEGVGAGWSAKWLNTRGGEWDWKTFRRSSASEDSNSGPRDDARSITSLESARGEDISSKANDNTLQPTASSRSPAGSRSAVPPAKTPTNTTNVTRQHTTSTTRRPTTGPSANGPSTSAASPAIATSSRTKAVPIPLSVPKTNYPPSVHFPLSPRSQRQHNSSVLPAPDPHPHPAQPPLPASALSMYQVAHRYGMPGLSSLALEHMMSTLTPQSSLPLLLAASMWDALRSLIEVGSAFLPLFALL
jgi:hypothetical protein